MDNWLDLAQLIASHFVSLAYQISASQLAISNHAYRKTSNRNNAVFLVFMSLH